jgi:shikimate dehydrogenase
MQIVTGKTKLLGIIGKPLEHSLSPVMQNAALNYLNLDYIYIPFPVTGADIAKALGGFEAINLVGFNVTIPHKQAIIPLLTEVSPIAQMVGAVNTVWRTGRGWSGTNTDVAGFIAPLQSLNRDWYNITPVILGAGGAARAVVVGCEQLGCREIHLIGRNLAKLEEFRQSWHNSGLTAKILVHPWEELSGIIANTQLLINTTPVGMYPKGEESPVEEKALEKLPEKAIVYDLIYTPNPTQFLKLAARQGAVTIDGLEMLVQQGAAALEIWVKEKPPVEVMRQSLRKYLGLDESQ